MTAAVPLHAPADAGTTFGRRYLARPERFPAAPEAAGRAEAADLLLASGPYRLTGLTPGQRGLLDQRFGRFSVRAGAGAPAVELRLAAAPPGSLRPPIAGRWEYSFDLDPGPDGLRLAGVGFYARLDRRPGSWRAGLWLNPDDLGSFLGVLTNVLRVVVAHRLLADGGALLHSAAVACGGEGLIFVGRSGAGKSTVAGQALERGLDVLSDELAALIPRPGGAAVVALPFAGDLEPVRDPALPLPLGRVLLLAQASHDALSPVPPSLAVAAAAVCAPWVNGDPHAGPQLLANLARLFGGVPAARLEFRRAGSFWPLLGVAEAAA